ncbi:MAG TPA: 8-oxo-dGTP diphosphatase MutT [Methylomirabilota bacterium]|nr:8-oxo-dGTP diphosphatase MutT [Methylomirabilota bacterium]
MGEVVEVVAAVIERDRRYLITRRLDGTHLAGLWEFPGGKILAGELPEAALVRELAEELAVTADVGELLESVDWSYPEKKVRILFFRCSIQGEPRPLQGQEMLWIEAAELPSRRFPEADAHLVGRLARTR